MQFKLWLENNQVYYHGSRRKFPDGFTLTPQAIGYVHDEKKVEDFVEKYRPPNKLSRFKSVFMVTDPEEIDYAGGYEDFIYEVMPVGVVEKSDLSWYSEISVYLHEDNQVEPMIEAAKNYWSGVPFTDPKSSLFEYRTSAATITRRIS